MTTWHEHLGLFWALYLHADKALSSAREYGVARELEAPLSSDRRHYVQGTIEGRRDIAGGRKTTDRRAAGNSTSGQCFTSLAFSADGSLAAGRCVSQHSSAFLMDMNGNAVHRLQLCDVLSFSKA